MRTQNIIPTRAPLAVDKNVFQFYTVHPFGCDALPPYFSRGISCIEFSELSTRRACLNFINKFADVSRTVFVLSNRILNSDFQKTFEIRSQKVRGLKFLVPEIIWDNFFNAFYFYITFNTFMARFFKCVNIFG